MDKKDYPCCFKKKLFPWIYLLPIIWFILSFWYYKCNIQHKCNISTDENNSLQKTTITNNKVLKNPTIKKNCIDLLLSDIELDGNNNISEVKKLENFLNSYENEKLPINGIYEQDDFEALKRFQKKYSKEILEVDSLTEPTGFVHKTTKKQINKLYCSNPNKLK